jgi:hypothetical protein
MRRYPRRFPFLSRFHDFNNANMSRRVRAGREISTENQEQTGVGLSNGKVTVAEWAIYRRFSLPVCFTTFKNANISETARAGRGVSNEHEYKTEVGLLTGHVLLQLGSELTHSTSTLDVRPQITCQRGSAMHCCKGHMSFLCEIYTLFAHLLQFMTKQIQRFSFIRLNGLIYLLLIVSLLLTDMTY